MVTTDTPAGRSVAGQAMLRALQPVLELCVKAEPNVNGEARIMILTSVQGV